MAENGNGTPRTKPQSASGLYVRSPNGIKVRDERVRRLVRKMRNQMPWLEDSDVPTCRAYAEIEVLASRAYSILSSVGLINREGEPVRLLTDFRLLRQTQLSYANALGMSPAARMAIKANGTRAPFDLAAALAAPADPDAGVDGVVDDGVAAGAAADGQQR